MINCIKLAGKDAGAPRGSWHVSLGVLAALFLPVLNSGAAFAIPAAEKLLPDDTLVMVTVPDFGKLREIYGKLPQSQLWNDAAMKPFKDKFLAKWKEEFVKPLERELQVRFDDYQGLLEGQLTFALVQNATAGKDEEPVGGLGLLEPQTKAPRPNDANGENPWPRLLGAVPLQQRRTQDAAEALSANAGRSGIGGRRRVEEGFFQGRVSHRPGGFGAPGRKLHESRGKSRDSLDGRSHAGAGRVGGVRSQPPGLVSRGPCVWLDEHEGTG